MLINALIEIVIYLLYCYIITAISKAFMFLTDTGQMFGKWQNVLDWLYSKAKGEMNGWQVLYKALGGCDACNAMWFSVLLYPIYLYAGSVFGFASIALNDCLMFAVFWVLAPLMTFDILSLKNRE